MDQGHTNSHGHISYEDFVRYRMSSKAANLNSLSDQRFYDEEKTISLGDLLGQKQNTVGGSGSITRDSSTSSLTRSGKLGSLTTGSENSLGN